MGGIRHRSPKLGEGVVQGVVQGVETPDGGLRLVVTFPSLDPGEATKRFTADALGPYLEWLWLRDQPAGFEEHVAKARADELELRRLTEERLKEERAHREREQAALAEFEGLRQRFGIEGCTDTSATSPVYAALLHLREGKVVGDEIASALKSVGYWNELAMVYEIQFGLTGDIWDLVKAASTFRKAKAPRRALKVLADATNPSASSNVHKRTVDPGPSQADRWRVWDQNRRKHSVCGRGSKKSPPKERGPFRYSGGGI